MNNRPSLLHYRSQFLPASETFIRTLVAHHQRYQAAVVTHERVGPLSDDPAPVHVLPDRSKGLDGGVAHWVWPTQLRHRVAALRCALNERRPALIHAHFGQDAVAAASAASALGIPSVAAFYGYDATTLARSALWRRRFRRLFRRASAVLAEGPAMAERLAALGCPVDRLVIQPIPIEIDLFPFRLPQPRVDRTVVLQACRFVDKKGVDLTIRAFARVAVDHPRLELRLIGDGPERASLERLARQSGVANRIRFLGMRSHEDYARELCGADIFMQPSRTARDGDGEGGAPTTLLEAQAIGLPIVATRHADIPWVVDPTAALLAQEEDVVGLAAQLEYVLAHPQEWAGRARAGRRQVVDRHAADAAVRSLEGLYDRILQDRSS